MKPGSVDVGPPAQDGEGRARRSFVHPDKLATSPAPGVNVLADIMVKAVDKFPNGKVSIRWSVDGRSWNGMAVEMSGGFCEFCLMLLLT